MAASAQASGCPPSFICPLTLEIMEDPVTAADGHSYEAAAIREWFKTSNMSPLTGLPMNSRKLIPSHALRNAISEFQAAKAVAAAPVARPPASAASGSLDGGMGGASKLILIGDAGVGKTSLVYRIKEGHFSTGPPTIGASFCTHSVRLPDGGRLPLAIWDTAGQEKYRSFTRQYFRGASAVLVCYDISSLPSFEGAGRWVRELQEEALFPAPVMALIGTKFDLEEQRQVSREDARQLAQRERMLSLECSAKEGTQVDAVFEEVARAMQARGLAGGPRSGDGLRLARMSSHTGSHASRAGCC